MYLIIRTALIAALATASPLLAEETTDLVKKLKGNGGTTTRGLTRGFNKPSGSTRSVVLGASRGIPTSIKAAAEEDSLSMTKPQAHAGSSKKTITVSYKVDDSSQVTRNNILFQRGSTEFTDEASYKAIAELSAALRNPELATFKFVIEGHASADGDQWKNQKLSQLRAEKIKTVMVALGVPNANLIPIGFGEAKAIHAENAPETKLRLDRKVIIFRLNK